MPQFVFALAIIAITAAIRPSAPAPRVSLLQSQLPSGADIAARVNARDIGQTASRAVVMELIDGSGRARTRATRSFRKEYDTETRTIIFFTSPTSVQGTALLTYDYAEPRREDDQWLYLPALRRVRRLSSANRLESFLGSDFSYDDIRNDTKIDVEHYALVTIGRERVDGHDCYLVEATPTRGAAVSESGFSRVRHWIDADIWMPRRGDYWDGKGRLTKTVQVTDIRQVDGIWTPHRFEAVTHRTGHRTILHVSDVNYGQRLEDDLFTEGGLGRGF